MTFTVEYIDPLLEESQFALCKGYDKTDARDIFYADNPNVERIVRLTRVYDLKA